MQENIESPAATFLAAQTFAVAGASRDRSKYGNKVFQALVASGRTVYPLNPSAPEIDGHVGSVQSFFRWVRSAMIPLTPTLKAERVTLENDIVRYRVYCDKCDDCHYHGPRDGHRECHCINPDSIYNRCGYFIELSPPDAKR